MLKLGEKGWGSQINLSYDVWLQHEHKDSMGRQNLKLETSLRHRKSEGTWKKQLGASRRDPASRPSPSFPEIMIVSQASLWEVPGKRYDEIQEMFDNDAGQQRGKMAWPKIKQMKRNKPGERWNLTVQRCRESDRICCIFNRGLRPSNYANQSKC